MSLLARLIGVILGALFGRTLQPMETSRLAMRVWPTDLDPNLHMNNGRYLTVMDLGRVDLMVRNRVAHAALKNRWMPVIAAVQVRYRRSLAPFERYTLTTRLLGWEGKWFYLEQQFVRRDGSVAALAWVKAAIRRRGGTVDAEALQRAMGVTLVPKPLAPDVARWIELTNEPAQVADAA
ncbi:MAG: thioesterase [Rhodospirillales bacterium]|jgi:acyl-CoA thioesterase FadM|nr:thioesterase [Rhodospirillales bacterium]